MSCLAATHETSGTLFTRAGYSGCPYTDKPHMMALPLQFCSPLQGRIGGAVALIAHRIDHKSDSQRTINALFNPVFAHCLILNHRAAMASAALPERV